MLSGCLVGPDFHRPKPYSPEKMPMPQSAKDDQKVPSRIVSTKDSAPDDWWDEFHDPVLSRLENDLARQNLTFRISALQLAQSRAMMLIAGAERFPELTGQGAYMRSQYSSKWVQRIQKKVQGYNYNHGSRWGHGSSDDIKNMRNLIADNAQTVIPELNHDIYSLQANYEVDLWGRVARQYASSKALAAQSLEQRRTVLLSLQAELARDYIGLRANQRQYQLLQESQKSLEALLRLTQDRYRSGLVSDLDVEATRAQLAQVQAELPALRQDILVEMNAISLLMGQPPEAVNRELETPAPIPQVPHVVEVGLPSSLAERRPDIRGAEDNLKHAVAELGEAEADFYPKVTINADFGFQALSFRDLGFWNARTWNLGPAISIPIFQGGRIYGQYVLKKKAEKEAALAYRRTVLTAWSEVSNALIGFYQAQQKDERLAVQVRAEQRSYDLALSQYKSGLSTYLEVLAAQNQLQLAQTQKAKEDGMIAVNLARLYNALGGGWQNYVPLTTWEEKEALKQAKSDAKKAARDSDIGTKTKKPDAV